MARQKLDAYQWSKARIESLYSNVATWEDDVLDSTDKHDIWSIKKLFTLSLYVGPFVRIMRKRGFQNLCYVDPFSGSGLIRLMQKYRFPGSPLIPLARVSESPFDKYYLSDIDGEYISILKQRVHRMCGGHSTSVSINQASCDSAIKSIFSGSKPARWKDNGHLVFLDSYGLDVNWNTMERILKSGAVDVIFTFMTWAVRWNQDIEKSEAKLNAFFGDTAWKNLETEDALLAHYCKKIESLGYDPKYKTYPVVVVQDRGRKYHMILASQSEGAGRVFRDLQKRVEPIDTDMLKDAFGVVVGSQTDLDSYR